MKRVTFGLGQELDASGRTIPNIAAKRQTAYKYIASTFGGFNAVPGVGGYIGSNGLAVESSLTVSVYTDQIDLVHRTAEYLCELFLQESVLVAIEPVESLQFVSTNEERVAA